MPQEGQIVLDVYMDMLVETKIEFKKQNSFINVIGVKKLTGRNPNNSKIIDDIMGFSNSSTTQDEQFYSIILGNLYIIERKISQEKILIHELGHCFNLKHGDYHASDCFMQQGEIDDPAFCERCLKEIKNLPIFIDR